MLDCELDVIETDNLEDSSSSVVDADRHLLSKWWQNHGNSANTNAGFQIDTDEMAHFANKGQARRDAANQQVAFKHRLENPCGRWSAIWNQFLAG